MWNTRQRLLVFRSLSLGLSCGVSVRQCLATAGGVPWLAPVLQRVGDGEPLSKALRGCLSLVQLERIREGERAGTLPQAIDAIRLLEIFDRERKFSLAWRFVSLPLVVASVIALLNQSDGWVRWEVAPLCIGGAIFATAARRRWISRVPHSWCRQARISAPLPAALDVALWGLTLWILALSLPGLRGGLV